MTKMDRIVTAHGTNILLTYTHCLEYDIEHASMYLNAQNHERKTKKQCVVIINKGYAII